VENLEELLTAARGAEIIFYDAYLTYEDEPEKVQHYLEALSRISVETRAKRVIVEQMKVKDERWGKRAGS